MHYSKHKVDRAWPAMVHLLNAAWANFGPPGIFKWEVLNTGYICTNGSPLEWRPWEWQPLRVADRHRQNYITKTEAWTIITERLKFKLLNGHRPKGWRPSGRQPNVLLW